MEEQVAINVCEGFYRCLTADGKLSAIVTLLTIVGAFGIASYASKQERNKYFEASKEESRKIYLEIEKAFIKTFMPMDLWLNSQNGKQTELMIYTKEIEYQIGRIKDSNIIQRSPSAIYRSLQDFVDKSEFALLIFKNILLLLENSDHEKFEEYLLDEKTKGDHDKMNELIDIAKIKSKEIKNIYEEIEKLYK